MSRFILLDDDSLVHMMWKLEAKKANAKIECFTNKEELEDFLLSQDWKDAYIYLDSDLGDGVKGEELASKLHQLGYQNLFLTTGHDPDDFKDLKFLKGILDKTPPKFDHN